MASRQFLKPADAEEALDWKQDRLDTYATEVSTAFVYNSMRSQSIEKQRQRLPVFRYRNHILNLVENYQTVVVVGETGCGKSTQIAQYLLEAGWGSPQEGLMIGVTQPRRIAATSLATRVAEERGCDLGDVVGYSIRFDDCVTPGTTKIKFLTEGILIREMMSDPLLRNYCVIMVDEVHERSLFTDILLGLLKKILRKRKDLRLVISSATMDAEELKDYFDLTTRIPKAQRDDRKPYGKSIILTVEGRHFPVEVLYLKEPVPDYVTACVDTVLKIHDKEDKGDVLVFLTGQEEVDRAVNLLTEHAQNRVNDKEVLYIIPMYGSLPFRDQIKAFQRPPQGCRKIVVATNVAEASVTIPGIVYVVDCGFVKLRWYNPDTQTDALVVVPISQASCVQRAGRAGRMRPGKVYRCYTEEAFHTLPEYTPPEMQRTNLSPAILQLKALGIDNVLRFDFPSPPPARTLATCLQLLYALEAMDKSGHLTHPLGERMAELPLDPLLARLLCISGEFECSQEIAAIVAMLQIQNIFVYPRGAEAIRARMVRRRFEAREGDLLTYLNVFCGYAANEGAQRWCSQNYVNKRALQRGETFQKQLLSTIKKMGIPTKSCRGDAKAVLRCITAGMFPNTAYLHMSGEYRTVAADVVLHVHPHSVFYTEERPPWVIFGEVLHTTQLFMRDLVAIDPKWLEELASHYFQKVVEK